MKIATFNVNSVKARVETVLAWFKQASPDVAFSGFTSSERSLNPTVRTTSLGIGL